MSSDRLRKQANEIEVTSERHAKGLVFRLTEEATNETDVTSKRQGMGLVLGLIGEASVRNKRDIGKARRWACPQTD